VTTSLATNITHNSALVGGHVTADGGAAVTIRGVAYGTLQTPTTANSTTSDGTGVGVFSSTLTGLSHSTLYFVRAYAVNSIGTSYGNEIGFTTSLPPPALPTLTTSAVTDVSSMGAITGGEISADGYAAVTARGVVYSTSINPTIVNQATMNGNGIGVFTSVLTGLTQSTLYYVRAYATNSVGTAYGNERSFSTLAFVCGTSPVADGEGNIYNTVHIGNQCWTQSNLNVTKFRNGDDIANLTNGSQWSGTPPSATGAWCSYNNNSANDATNGKLYNWYAVNDSRGLCPTGWHVPSDGEWTTLTNGLGGTSVAGGAMKTTTGWTSPNTGATNSSGFTGRATGFRSSSASFSNQGSAAYWWTSTDAGSGYAWSRGLLNYLSSVERYDYYKNHGFSVRCVKDAPGLSNVSTTAASAITATAASTGGNVTSDGGAAVTARGVVYGTAQNPTTANSTTSDGTGTGAFNSTLTGLTASTLYYVRAYATNSAGTAYGNEVSFTTLSTFTCGTSTVSDVDNNTYATVQIGTQCWTQSNLKVSKYRNGDNIPTGLSNAAWQNTLSGAYAIYNNDVANDALYGKLYNWYAVMDSRGLCPTGWHVPSDGEWTTLTDFLGGESVAGGAMKSTATQPTPGGWNAPNTGATNSSGFTGLPGGFRDPLGGFDYLGVNGVWWSSSDAGSGSAWRRFLHYNYASAIRSLKVSHRYGHSVRCVRD
jgi:uncharacterized protein (TIGR02145 family)